MYKRNCPTCNKVKTYTNKISFNRAITNGSLCGSCSKKKWHKEVGHSKATLVKISKGWFSKDNPGGVEKHTEETKKKISSSKRGSTGYWMGKSLSESHRKNLSDSNKGLKKTEWFRKCPECKIKIYYSCPQNLYRSKREKTSCYKCSYEKSTEKRLKNLLKSSGWQKSKEFRQKMRMIRLKQIEQNFGQVMPSYNREACKIIDEYGKKYGYNFQHAENGGEYHIKELGYWVDGYDKDKNVVIEYYEKAHDRKVKKDTIRQTEIMEHLKHSEEQFIIIKE